MSMNDDFAKINFLVIIKMIVLSYVYRCKFYIQSHTVVTCLNWCYSNHITIITEPFKFYAPVINEYTLRATQLFVYVAELVKFIIIVVFTIL